MFDLCSYLKDIEIDCVVDEELKKHGTMKVGGTAKFFVKPDSIDKLITVITVCKLYEIKYFVIGNASNIIFTDKGFDGAIITTKHIKDITHKGNMVTAKCGNMMREVSSYCLKNELSGFENLSGIPASIGGACYMNAGAYGSEMKDVLASVKVLDKDGNCYTISRKDMNLSYRHSNFMDDGLIVLEATFILKKGSYEEIENIITTNDKSRKEKQPIAERSVGSTFKRPKEEGVFASKLIDDANLKGFSIGGAEVSTKHAGFVINKNNATFDDLQKLIAHIQKVVYEQSNIELELEAIIVGEV